MSRTFFVPYLILGSFFTNGINIDKLQIEVYNTQEMVNYPNEKKARNQELLKDTLDGMSMLDRIIKYRVSSVRIGLIVRRETVKIMKNTLTSTSATIASNYDIPEDKIIKLIEKEKLKIALPKPTII